MKLDIPIYDEEKLKNDPDINFNRPYQQCSISVMDTIADPDITFDEKGICNYYYEYLEKEKEFVFKGKEGEEKLAYIISEIKKSGEGEKYDCLTGISGGVDSTYLCLQAKKLGLRPLIVHFDNGWNSELAVKNIENIIEKLGFDLYTLVVDWNEFKDLQLAYLKASVVDIEAISDHAISGTLFRLAAENKIKYILSGYNIVTEATLPSFWVFNKSDDANIKDIHKKFGTQPLKTYPFFGLKQRKIYGGLKGISSINLLNYLPYNKQLVKKIITEELGWRDYGGKHYESIFTRFYQGYILPLKFGIDKRKAHLSNLIFSGQITKQEALIELQKPVIEEQQLHNDYEFVLKKFGLSQLEFEKILLQPRREHKEFAITQTIYYNYPILNLLKPLIYFIRKIGIKI
ncbi:MAG: N-acetyl sugar amidotransferase [Chitinophagaceae bacterium]|nr:N-acetyl sugar amidotransferase [Chitinophagaceae bacterium]